MKRLADLSVEDLESIPIWRYEAGSGVDALVAPTRRVSLSQRDDEIFLAATAFELSDGSRHFGFCFPADDSGIDYLQPVIVTPSGHVSFWFESQPSDQMLATQWKALGKEPAQIFPAAFRCLVAVDGRTVSGRVEGIVSSGSLTSGLPGPSVDAGEADEEMDARVDDRILTARPVQPRRTTGPVEKRTARRHKAEVKVEFTQGSLHGTGIAGDLSPRGMFVRSAQVPGTGPMLRLRVNLPEGRSLVLTGRVIRGATISSAPPNGFGLRLAEDSPEYEDLVSRLRNKRK